MAAGGAAYARSAVCPSLVSLSSPDPLARRGPAWPRADARSWSPVALLVLCALLVVATWAPAARADDEPLPAGAPTGTVQGVVRDEQGAPIRGVVVRASINRTTGNSMRWWDRETRTGDDGRYVLRDVLVPVGSDALNSRLTFDSPDWGLATDADFGTAFQATPLGTTYVSDMSLLRRDVTLRGRVSVRDGASPAGASVRAEAIAVDPVRDDENEPRWWDADVAPDGTWSVRIPPVPVRLRGDSTFGLPTGYPDLPSIRRDSPVLRTTHGEVREGLDLSLRARLPHAALDEYGQAHQGSAGTNLEVWEMTERYGRDPHRSVLSTVGARIAAGAVTNVDDSPLGLPANDPVTITGMPIPVQLTLRNDGDDDLWLGAVRFEGAAATCFVTGPPAPCADAYVLPGTTRTVRVTVDSTRWSEVYRTTLVLPSNAGADLRVPVAVRNLATADYDPNDPSHPVPLGLVPYLPPAQLALALANGNLRGPVARALALATLTLTRTRVGATFPGAGSATVTIARARPRRARRPTTWRTVQRVRLTRNAAGRSVRAIRPLAAGRYRLRTVTRITGRPSRTTTTYRTVRRAR